MSGRRPWYHSFLKCSPLLVIAIIVYSIVASSVHYHAISKDRADCLICKFGDDLSSGAAAKPLFLVILELDRKDNSLEHLSRLNEVIISSKDTRAPPAF